MNAFQKHPTQTQTQIQIKIQTTTQTTTKPKWQRYAMTGLGVALVVLGVALGQWQLSRAEQKQMLQNQLTQQAQLPVLQFDQPANLPSSLPSAQLLQNQTRWMHRKIQLTGHWLLNKTIFLENRQMDGRVGFFVVTPLQLDSQAVILVQRGWVARHFLHRTQLPDVPTPSTKQTIHGRLAPPPSKLLILDASKKEIGNIRLNIDPQALGKEWGTTVLPMSVLQLDENAPPPISESTFTSNPTPHPNPAQLKRHWHRPDLGIDKHHGYAFQWFALALLVLCWMIWQKTLIFKRNCGHKFL